MVKRPRQRVTTHVAKLSGINSAEPTAKLAMCGGPRSPAPRTDEPGQAN